jgi:hypothetical protein
MTVVNLKMQFLPAAIAAGLFVAGAYAQAPPAPSARRAPPPRASAAFAQQPPLPVPPPPPEGFDMLGFDTMRGDRVVKGSPLSAVGVSESSRVLADGTKIHRQTSTAIFRDSQGRLRKEITLPAIGPLAAQGEPPQFVAIHDPVAGLRFTLNLQQKTARKRIATSAAAPRREKLGANLEGAGESDMIKTESLGTQVIEGVSAEGTRTTRTIPVGRIGNDRPIAIVSEVWYSPDLQMVVMTRRSDPRSGETTYKLTNIQRTEPAASLFQVPADFTVEEGRPARWERRRQRGPASIAPPSPDDELQ